MNDPSMNLRSTPSSPRAWRLLGALVLASLRIFGQSTPNPPEVLVYQGVAIDGSGLPFGGTSSTNVAAVFRVFTAYTGGSLLWSEQHTLALEAGRFAVLLGEGSARVGEPRPALSSLFVQDNASDRYVELTLLGAGGSGKDLQVTPRVRLLSAPSAFLAAHARTAERLVNGTGTTVVSASASKVGLLKAQPEEALDIAGGIKSESMALTADVTVSGTATVGMVEAVGMAPLGSVVMWSGTVPPRGWALCNGQMAHGYQTPDLRGRFLMAQGSGQGLTPRNAKDVGGSEAHALTQAEMPTHDHVWDPAPITTQAGGAHTHPYISAYKAPAPLWLNWGQNRASWEIGWLPETNWTSSDGIHHHGLQLPAFQSASAGEGRPHNSMPPFHVLAFIMRVQ